MIVQGFHLIRQTDSIKATKADADLPITPNDAVVVNAGETLALLLHASQRNRAWLRDFADETMHVSRDMYDVLLNYQRLAQEESSRAA